MKLGTAVLILGLIAAGFWAYHEYLSRRDRKDNAYINAICTATIDPTMCRFDVMRDLEHDRYEMER